MSTIKDNAVIVHPKLNELFTGSLQRERHIANDPVLGETGTSIFVRGSLFIIAVIIFVFIAWAALASLDETAVASGKVIPSEHLKSVQHLEGGIITEILVEEGEVIEKGQALVRFDAAAAQAEHEKTLVRRAALLLQIERLRALVEGRTVKLNSVVSGFSELKHDQQQTYKLQHRAQESKKSVIKQQIRELQTKLKSIAREKENLMQRVTLLKEEVSMRGGLWESKLGSKLEFIRAQHALAEDEGELRSLIGDERSTREQITEYNKRLLELEDDNRDKAMQELGKLTAELAEVEEIITSLEDRVERLLVVAPVSGIIQSLPLKTIGGVLSPGGMVAEIVPLDGELIVEARVNTRDIGFVGAGQPVKVKVETYNFARYGSVDGTLDSVSATTFVEEDSDPYYKAYVKLAQAYVGSDPQRYPILPGMTVQADINTGAKTVLQYILKPIYTNLDEAFRER